MKVHTATQSFTIKLNHLYDPEKPYRRGEWITLPNGCYILNIEYINPCKAQEWYK